MLLSAKVTVNRKLAPKASLPGKKKKIGNDNRLGNK